MSQANTNKSEANTLKLVSDDKAKKDSKSFRVVYSSKNEDVKNYIENRESGVQLSDYVCDCIRFYEKYKNTIDDSVFTKREAQNFIDERVKEIISSSIVFNPELLKQLMMKSDDENNEISNQTDDEDIISKVTQAEIIDPSWLNED